MVSLRVLERNELIDVLPIEQIEWTAVNRTIFYEMTRKGVDHHSAEDAASHGVVETIGANSHISAPRALRDARGAAWGWLIAERSRPETASDLPDTAGPGRIEMRESDPQRSAGSTRDRIRDNRKTAELVAEFGWLIEAAGQTVDPAEPEQVDMLWSVRDAAQDTWQCPPVRTRLVVHGDLSRAAVVEVVPDHQVYALGEC